jgi:hypothetical protein
LSLFQLIEDTVDDEDITGIPPSHRAFFTGVVLFIVANPHTLPVLFSPPLLNDGRA